MNASVILRLGSVGALAALLAGCGMTEADPHRFESVADQIAAIPLSSRSAEPAREPAGPRNAREAGLRPLKVELLTPHQLWDARDGLTSKAAAVLPAMPPVFLDPEAPPAVQAAQQSAAKPSRPAVVAASSSSALIQLGAYASQASAQAAWERLGQGTSGLNPVFEPVEVNGRRLIRLKVRAGSAQAKALCAKAAAADPWCVRAAAGASSTGAA
ncbi:MULTISPECIES: SPOR domain-containing protein [unclassified Brevundimonas]|uniref:SPOR domain-containing protein n=1 Tax=unclassified Brevundimonas TaxID=2622653 RepID=UPI003F8E61BC